jgi:hypothetical protein
MTHDDVALFEPITLNNCAPAQFAGSKIRSHEMACTFFERCISDQQKSTPHWNNAITALNDAGDSAGIARARYAFLEALICEGYVDA